MRFLLLAFAAMFAAGCSTTPRETVRSLPPVADQVSGISIDYVGLQRSLGLNRSSDDLGFEEKSFNTCEAGYGYSSSHDCRRQYFMVLNLRIQCRDSEGTVSSALSASDMQAIAGRSLTWSMNGLSGTAKTDGEGYTQIRAISGRPQKQERLKLALGSQFLHMRAGDMSRIVTPRPWCDQ